MHYMIRCNAVQTSCTRLVNVCNRRFDMTGGKGFAQREITTCGSTDAAASGWDGSLKAD